MSNAEAINQALVAANAAQLAGFEYTQRALLEIANTLQNNQQEQNNGRLAEAD